MKKDAQYRTSLLSTVVIGAVGAFIFWGVFAGWFSSGDIDTQLAAPGALETEDNR